MEEPDEEKKGALLVKPKKRVMGSSACFHIGYRDSGKSLVLTVAEKDKYAPRETGVYDITLDEAAKDKDGKHKLSQLWSYDAQSRMVFSRLHTDKVLFEGANKNVIVYKQNKSLPNEKFGFDLINNRWYNELTQRAMVPERSPKPGVSIVTGDVGSSN
mmetsp:Transcript_13054/g.20266  ORF Transcript_13054/g.20266 Transcript_13054/m.20266 type:complete len:158 (+) Transcript_13054:1178-1651(+)